MDNRNVTFVFAALLLAGPAVTRAQSAAGEAMRHFAEVREEIHQACLEQCGSIPETCLSDEVISQEEIECFLGARVQKVLVACPHLMIPDVELYVERQTTVRILNRSDVNGNRDNAIEEGELAGFEAARLDPPLTDVGSLLGGAFNPCPPVGSPAASASAPAAAPAAPQPSQSWLDRIDAFISLRQSFLDARVIGNPATIGWSWFGRDDEILDAGRERSKYEIRAAVSLEPVRFFGIKSFEDWGLSYNPVFVVEADLSSEARDQRDLMTHRVGYQLTWARNDIDRFLTGNNLDFTVDYLTDRDYEAEAYGLTVQYTPNLPRLAVGSPWVAGPFELRWRPYAGLLYRDVQDEGRSPQLKGLDSFADAYARVSAELAISRQLKVTPEITLFREFENEKDLHVHRLFSARWVFDQQERVSIVLSHERGETSPAFKKRNLTKLALGLKLL